MITHTRPTHATLLLWILTAVSVLATPSWAQDSVTVTTELSRNRAYLGDEVSYQIVVSGSQTSAEPQIPFPSSVRAQYMGASRQSFTSTVFENGRQRMVREDRITHQYRLTATESGTIEIPGGTVLVDGQRYTTQPRDLIVLLPQESFEDSIEIQIPDRPIFVGESFEAEVTWWIGDRTREFSFEPSVIPDGFIVEAGRIDGPAMQQLEMDIAGTRVVARTQQGISQGREAVQLRFNLRLTPTAPGRYELGPIRAVFTRIDSSGRGARMYSESQARIVEIVPVPTEGKPSTYSGLIGHYGLELQAANTAVNVGDPIELSLDVQGPEPMSGIERSIRTDALEAAGFRVAPDGWRLEGGSSTGTRRYTTTVRATDASIDQIPSISIDSFDPDSRSYETFGSEPIPLEVRAVRTVTLDDAIVSAPNTDRAPSVRDELTRNPSVLWSHPNADSIRHGTPAFDLRERATSPVWIGVFAFGIAFPIVAMAAGAARKNRSEEHARMRRAWSRARALHKKGEHAQAVRVYAGAALGVHPDSLTRDDLSRLAASDEIKQRTRAILGAHEARLVGAQVELPHDKEILHSLRSELASRREHRRLKENNR